MESNSATPSGRGLCQRKAIFDHSEGQVDGFQVEPVWDDGGPCSSAARRFPQMSWPPGDGLTPRPSHRRSSACPASLSAHDGLIRVKTIISIVRGRAIRMKTIISMVHGTPCIAAIPVVPVQGPVRLLSTNKTICIQAVHKEIATPPRRASRIAAIPALPSFHHVNKRIKSAPGQSPPPLPPPPPSPRPPPPRRTLPPRTPGAAGDKNGRSTARFAPRVAD